MAASLWPKQRRQDHGIYVASVMCPRCGLHPDIMLHKIWQCAHDEGLAVEKTKNMAERAQAGALDWLCFWLRGLLPARWMPLVPCDEVRR